MKESSIILNQNPAVFRLSDLPMIDYVQFWQEVSAMMKNENNHIVAYFPLPDGADKWRFICAVADDANKNIQVFSHECSRDVSKLESLTPEINAMHIFEREMHENNGIDFPGHPWLKPVRWPHNRYDQSSCMNTYPFFSSDSIELHQVGVGPVHAGIIEPGHFRFICNGEKVYHLEIHLGYQHRGVEDLFVSADSNIKRAVLSDSIAGDTAVGHSLCHAQLMEELAGNVPDEMLQMERAIALELERIAFHIGDTSALCADIAYQLGQVVCESLRTVVINTTQYWCGNRLGKGFIRAGGTHYPMTKEVANEILKNLQYVENRYSEMAAHLFSMPGALSRFDGIGVVSKEQGLRAGLTGMAARMCGIPRDVRTTHPFQAYKKYKYKPEIFTSGDVLARALMRRCEISKSIELIRTIVGEILSRITNPRQNKSKNPRQNDDAKNTAPNYNLALAADSVCISMTEGWRGEIVHVAVTDNKGAISKYKITDPSLHNWTGLALAVRNQEISDFPVCNKSFNLSYCGYDL
ncbi:MAG TPA: NADH-quinone oxidoreductase subunit C [Bacteroidales bacterium]|nr:NADH-quinone oxidoreductase subunit C [Bacteroidales bacterium]